MHALQSHHLHLAANQPCRKLHLEQEKSTKLADKYDTLEKTHAEAEFTILELQAEIERLQETVRVLHEGLERQEVVLEEAVVVNESYQQRHAELQTRLEEEILPVKVLRDVYQFPPLRSVDNIPGSEGDEPADHSEEDGPPGPSDEDLLSLYGNILGTPRSNEQPWTPERTVGAIEVSTEKAAKFFQEAKARLAEPTPAVVCPKSISAAVEAPLPIPPKEPEFVLLPKKSDPEMLFEDVPSFPDDSWVKFGNPGVKDTDIWMGEYERSTGRASARRPKNRGGWSGNGDEEVTPTPQPVPRPVRGIRQSDTTNLGTLTTHTLHGNPIMTPKFERKLVRDVADSVMEKIAPLFGRSRRGTSSGRFVSGSSLASCRSSMDDTPLAGKGPGFLRPTVAARNKERGKIWGRAGPSRGDLKM